MSAPTIEVPNASIVDDTPGCILTRVCKRIGEKGFFVAGIYDGEWQSNQKGERVRQFEVDVAREEDGEPLGQVIVRHSRVRAYFKVPGIAFNPRHHYEIKDSTTLGWSGNVKEALGWE